MQKRKGGSEESRVKGRSERASTVKWIQTKQSLASLLFTFSLLFLPFILLLWNHLALEFLLLSPFYPTFSPLFPQTFYITAFLIEHCRMSPM
jgi:hypothetical protein